MPTTTKRRTHAADEVWRYYRARYGGCPEDHAEEIVGRVCERAWTPPAATGRAVELVAASYVRHRMTGYERLFEIEGLTREEARLIVKPEVDAIIASWKSH